MIEHRADIVVIGAGPAGIAAATTAAESRCDVLLVDEAAGPGGQVWRSARVTGGSRRAARWLTRLRSSGARTLYGTAIIDAPAPLTMLGEHEGKPVRIIANRTVILATGARELFLPFPGWTLPGVIGAGGAQALLKSGWNVRDRSVVVAGSGPLLLPVAAALSGAGARVRAVAEQAPARVVRRFALGLWRSPGRLLTAARYRAGFARVSYTPGTWVTAARGEAAVREIVLSNGRSERTIACDVLCVGFGLVPAVELPALFGCALHDGAVAVDPWMRTSVSHVYCAGEPTGIRGLDSALVEGEIAARAATGRESGARTILAEHASHVAFARRVERAFRLRAELRAVPHADTIVCRCEDVTHGAVRACGSLREAKLLTRAGMGACQGRVCGAALCHIHGWERDSVRPPLSPATIATLAMGSITETSA